MIQEGVRIVVASGDGAVPYLGVRMVSAGLGSGVSGGSGPGGSGDIGSNLYVFRLAPTGELRIFPSAPNRDFPKG